MLLTKDSLTNNFMVLPDTQICTIIKDLLNMPSQATEQKLLITQTFTVS